MQHRHRVSEEYLTSRGVIRARYRGEPIPCEGCDMVYYRGKWKLKPKGGEE